MSPTSYQAAPPRNGIIAEAEWYVKRTAWRVTQIAAKIDCAKQLLALRLPGACEFFPDGLADLAG